MVLRPFKVEVGTGEWRIEEQIGEVVERFLGFLGADDHLCRLPPLSEGGMQRKPRNNRPQDGVSLIYRHVYPNWSDACTSP